MKLGTVFYFFLLKENRDVVSFLLWKALMKMYDPLFTQSSVF